MIKRANSALVVVALLALLSGCASMSVQQCQQANWARIGLTDGQSGVRVTRVDDYVKDCAEAGVQVAVADWTEAYELGLLSYCLPENGFLQGRQGHDYHNVCHNDQFVERYNQGRALYLKEKRIAEIDTQLQQLDNQIAGLGVSDDDKENRKQLWAQRRQLLEERDRLLHSGVTFSISF
ncbi:MULTISPECIES: DUF2799 domain-containing protein [Ferrimonas]|uniref:DUF2799 domain-containing protein n=1 Tax=Ferrimonas TaxID=44011 RepID=UPI000414C931|nr:MULTISPECIES: DUF2799 domain-containing protein [Ferrimonas]USD37317.1 DUF2799 domain-containing protein [Ferrimonas sp. SCSIO 43195]